MLLTIKQLKTLIQNAPDDALFGSMDFASDKEIKLYAPKRALLLEGFNSQYFVLNNMGTHWDEKWGQNEFFLRSSFDRETGVETVINNTK